MLTFLLMTVEKTLENINSIEERAEALVRQARQSAALTIKKTNEKLEKEILENDKIFRDEATELIRQAEEQAREEAQRIAGISLQEISALKESTPAKIPAAKREIVKCLS